MRNGRGWMMMRRKNCTTIVVQVTLIMNKTQLDAARWAMNRYPNSSGALVRREDEILVMR